MTALRHGDMVRPGDEFNREPWYLCEKCGNAHGRDIPGCDGLRIFYWPAPKGEEAVAERNDLVDRLWSQALREGEGVTGVGRRMAQLVAEECVRIAENTVETGHADMGCETKAYATAVAIEDAFGLPRS